MDMESFAQFLTALGQTPFGVLLLLAGFLIAFSPFVILWRQQKATTGSNKLASQLVALATSSSQAADKVGEAAQAQTEALNGILETVRANRTDLQSIYMQVQALVAKTDIAVGLLGTVSTTEQVAGLELLIDTLSRQQVELHRLCERIPKGILQVDADTTNN